MASLSAKREKYDHFFVGPGLLACGSIAGLHATFSKSTQSLVYLRAYIYPTSVEPAMLCKRAHSLGKLLLQVARDALSFTHDSQQVPAPESFDLLFAVAVAN